MKLKTFNKTQKRSPRHYLFRFSSVWGVLSALLMTAIACTSNATSQTKPNPQPPTPPVAPPVVDPFAQTQVTPNFQFQVERQAGTCPKTVGLWLFSLGFEGGADHTVVPNMLGISAGPGKLVSTGKNQLVFEAPLNSNYASCVGKASSPQLSFYNFRFGNGKVAFQLNVSKGDGYREILYKGTSGDRPYILWRAAE